MTEVRPQTAQTDAGWINNMRAAEERVVFDEMNANYTKLKNLVGQVRAASTVEVALAVVW